MGRPLARCSTAKSRTIATESTAGAARAQHQSNDLGRSDAMALDLAKESRDHADHYWEKGYAIVRGLFDKSEMAEIQAESARIYAEGLKHHASYRHKNLYYEILPESFKGQRYMLQAHWFAWISPLFEKLRRDPRYLRVLEPLLGRDIKQPAQQIHWKPPGAGLTGYRFHQDLRFRERNGAYRDLMTAWINTGLAIDPATRANGCLRVISGSHEKGYLGLSDDGPLMKGATQDEELKKAGLDLRDIVDVELEPGDLAIWGLLTVHGSDANRSEKDRAFAISGYVKAQNSDRGEWAFRDGKSIPLGPEPEICKYEKLRENPGPFYEDSKWYAA
jgi:ectoine hydroxylase-related dioxygenase (phytanoyl-CoA dioxygenase family)